MSFLSSEFLESYKYTQPRNAGVLFQTVFLRTYSRWIPELKRRERWYETIKRVVEYSLSLYQGPASQEELTKEAELMYDKIFHLEVLPAGRTLWVGGTDSAKKYGESQYNCSFVVVDELEVFWEVFQLLLCGCGVGFRILPTDVEKLPKFTTKFNVIYQLYQRLHGIHTLENTYFESEIVNSRREIFIKVGDSKEGWVKALQIFLESLINNLETQIIMNFDSIRPKGSRINGFGGRAPGPEGLIEMFQNIEQIIRKSGGKLSTVDCLDIMNFIGKNVIVGGTRRSAEIALGDINDKEFMEAKKYLWITRQNLQRTMSNNSITFLEKPSKEQLNNIFENIKYNGEPGIFNLKKAREKRPNAQGSNPSLRAGTKVLTDKGIFPVESLQDLSFKVPNLNGEYVPAYCRFSGNKPLYKITLTGGHEYYATAEHKWPVLINSVLRKKETKNLWAGNKLKVLRRQNLNFGEKGNYGDGFFIGWLLGDGWITRRRNGRYQLGLIVGDIDIESKIDQKLLEKLKEVNCFATFNKDGELNTTNETLWNYVKQFGFDPSKQHLPEMVWKEGSEEFRRGLIDGLFSSDGHIDKVKARIHLTSSRHSLLREVSELLGFYGIKTHIRTKRLIKVIFPNGKDYQRTYNQNILVIDDYGSKKQFFDIFKLSHKRKAQRLEILKDLLIPKEAYIEIIAVEKTDLCENVWDLFVFDDTHCFTLPHCITGNCNEIILDSKGFCNLSCINLLAFVNKDIKEFKLQEAEQAIRLATRIGLRMTNVTVSLPKWDYVQKRDRLLGVSMTGIMDAFEALDIEFDSSEAIYIFQFLKWAANDEASKYAYEMRVPRPLLVSCIKPEGSVSQLPTVSSGIHKSYSPYYIRRIRVSNIDPVAFALKELGIPCEEDAGRKERLVFSFPIKTNTKIKSEEELAIRQLDRYLTVMKHYVDHNCSITITVGEEEWDKLIDKVYENWDDIIGISCLPKSTNVYPQLPYEAITEEQYNEMISSFPKDLNIKLPELVDKYELQDYNEDELEVDCQSGQCPIR